MQWLKDFNEFIREHKFWGLVLVAFTIVITAGAYLRAIDRVQLALAQLISAAITIDSKTGEISVKAFYAWAAIGLLVVIIFLSLFVWRAVRDRSGVMGKTFEKMMQAASQIAAQLYPEDSPPLKNLVRVRRTYLISENFDTAVTREDDYQALTDLHVERVLLAAEQDAEPCEFLDNLNFKVRDERGSDLVRYLPTKDAEFEK